MTEKQKTVSVTAVISAKDLKKIQAVIQRGDYINRSEFMRNAIRKELTRRGES